MLTYTILPLVAVFLTGEVVGSGEPSTYQILSLVDKTNPSGPYFIGKNYVSTNTAQWTPFTSFPLQRGSQNLQFQLKIGGQNSGIVPSSPLQRLQPVTTKPAHAKVRTELKPRNQQPFKHIGPTDSTLEDVSQSLLRTDLFGKLTRTRPELDLGTHFKYDLHPEEKLASEYWDLEK